MKISRPVFFISILLLCINLAVLTKYILFKHPADTYHRLRNIGHVPAKKHGGENWVLFATIRQICYSRMDDRYKFENIGGNILGFVPLGLLVSILFSRRVLFLKTVITVFGISLLFELTQLYTGAGVFDVDDLLLNTVGGVLGYIVFALVSFARKDETGSRGLRRSCHSA